MIYSRQHLISESPPGLGVRLSSAALAGVATSSTVEKETGQGNHRLAIPLHLTPAVISNVLESPDSHLRASTLIEVLGTLAVIGVLTTAAIPSIRSYKPDPLVAASRQLLNDLALARQQAITDHTTVFVVFIPPLENLRPELRAELSAAELRRLAAGQLVSYALYEKRSVGEQPGRSLPHYVTGWRTLPSGTAIAPQKFGSGIEPSAHPAGPGLYPTFDYIDAGKIYFNPHSDRFPAGFSGFPTIAFDYQGRLASRWESWHGCDFVLPLTRGHVDPAPASAGEPHSFPVNFVEDSPGSWTTLQTHIVIDGPTGRARLIRQKVP